jgi:rRNA maturation RNase YbeY
MSQIVQFHSADKVFNFKGKTQLKSFLVSLFKKEKKILSSINYIFCSDEYLLQINRNFLQHDYYTDIITFELSEDKNSILGEVYISLDRVKDNAQSVGVAYSTEALRVILHGALHLCGYKDKTKKEISLMREKEDFYISLYQKQRQ